ncbi:endoplasmic reticulum-based factor for assembly of V-ATPase-domain-containing protein [Biscogniauxia mediterranea]|nr:endoplasmic reticulum-based factor for assembly of V-ATPase-domain-containing protein [Biscogniauxia mediterranea]
MVLLTMTPSIVEALRILPEPDNIPEVSQDDGQLDDTKNKEPSLKDPAVGNPISHAQVIDIWKQLNTQDRHDIRLEGLLRGAAIYVPPPPPKPEPTDEYKQLMARLRREEEERSYERMLKKAPLRESFAEKFPHAPMAHSFAEVNKPSKAADLGTDDIEYGDVQKQVTLIMNFLVSIIGCGAALWMAAQWWSTSARLFLSLGGSIVVAIAEVAVYSAYNWRMTEGERKEKEKIEVKQIVQSWVVGEEKDEKHIEEPLSAIQQREVPEEETTLRRRLNPSTSNST